MINRRRSCVQFKGIAAFLALTTACLALVGCGGGDGGPSVQGVVTYEGQPVTSGLINFLAPGGTPVGGGLQSDGTYEVQLVAGEYKVRIDSPEEYAPEQMDEQGRPKPLQVIKPRQVPAKFAGFDSSGLTATVSEGESSQQIDFKLP